MVYQLIFHNVSIIFKSAKITEFGQIRELEPRFVKRVQDPQNIAHHQALASRSIPPGHAEIDEDVMGAVVYLASDASALVTGSALLIDGGWTAG